MISPGVYEFGYLALADIPFLLISVVSLGCAVRALIQGGRDTAWAMASGLLAGIAYATRNAGLANIVALVSAFALSVPFKLLSIRDALRIISIWLAGLAIIVVPLISRNVELFGAVQPYSSGLSEYGYVDSARIYMWSLLLDIFGSRTIAQLAWDFKGLLLVGVPACVLLVWGVLEAYRQGDNARRGCVLFLTLYCATGSAMVVMGRARFDWVETNLVRHATQYSWVVVALVLAAIQAARVGSLPRKILFSIAMLLLVVGRASAAYEDQRREAQIYRALLEQNDPWRAAKQLPGQGWILTNQLKLAWASNAELKALLARLPANAFIVSNSGSFLKYELNRTVRDFPYETLKGARVFALAGTVASGVVVKRPFFVVILPSNRMLREDKEGLWREVVISDARSGGFSPVANSPWFVLFEYRPN
jgi:hypothetical protein